MIQMKKTIGGIYISRKSLRDNFNPLSGRVLTAIFSGLGKCSILSWYTIKKDLTKRIFFIFFIIILFTYSFSQALLSKAYSEEKVFNVGLSLLDFEYKHPDGKQEVVTTAIWYPTIETPQPYTYYNNRGEGNVESEVVLNSSVIKKDGPYPFILFAHGAFGTGYNVAYFAEYLANRGYIVVAPDYVDTKPPDYTQQIAFARIKGGNVGNPLQVLRVAGQFVKDMAEDRDFFLSYLAEHRFRHTSFVIDKIIELNRDKNSIFYQTIKEDVIGVCGHSEGGLTILGKIGAHPDKQFKDNRIKAALVFSAPAYPFEESLNNIAVPIMLMVGDNDSPAVHPELPRRIIYDKAKLPKFYLVLKNATHFSFGNKGCGQLPLDQAVEDNPQPNAICRYGLAFFEKYLRGNLSGGKQLDQTDPAWAYYIKEEKEGGALEWGKEPPPGEGGPGGIRSKLGGGGKGEFMKRRRGERLRRWRGGDKE